MKLYDRKNALVAAYMLNDKVLPFIEEEDIRLLQVLTDRGTEFCVSLENHEYELYLVIEDVDHSKTKARHPQTKDYDSYCTSFVRRDLSSVWENRQRLDSFWPRHLVGASSPGGSYR